MGLGNSVKSNTKVTEGGKKTPSPTLFFILLPFLLLPKEFINQGPRRENRKNIIALDEQFIPQKLLPGEGILDS